MNKAILENKSIRNRPKPIIKTKKNHPMRETVKWFVKDWFTL
jgi:hypothetical protein